MSSPGSHPINSSSQDLADVTSATATAATYPRMACSAGGRRWGGTWRCCSGRGRTAAHGTVAAALQQREVDTWGCCSGPGRTAARGGKGHALRQREVGMMEMNSLSVESPGNNRQLLRWTPCPELGSVASDSRLWRPAPVVSSVDVPAPHLRARQCQESTLRAARWPRTQGMSIRGAFCTSTHSTLRKVRPNLSALLPACRHPALV